MPRLDLRLTRELENDTNGISGSSETSRAELVVSFNVFRGGSDWARRQQFTSRVSGAQEERRMACGEVRQTLLIAHNDITSLRAQRDYLERNQLAIGKARLTYRQQFSIGQRTLLDLLDSENEYFEIRRRYVNAGYDLILARARTLAGMGMLLETLGVQRRPEDVGLDFQTTAEPGGCALEAPLPAPLARTHPGLSESEGAPPRPTPHEASPPASAPRPD